MYNFTVITFVFLTAFVGFPRGETDGNDYLPTIDDFDFSGDRVPWEAVKLAGEFMQSIAPGSSPVRDMEVIYYPCEGIPDEYWIPTYDLLGVQRDFIALGYHGPGESPSLKKIMTDFYDNFEVATGDWRHKFDHFPYYKYMYTTLVNCDYTSNGVSRKPGVPSIVKYRLVADEMAENYFGNKPTDCRYILFFHSGSRYWGYKYFYNKDEIYIRIESVKEWREEYWTQEDVDRYLRELEDEGIFKPWDEEKTNTIKEEQRAIWIERIKGIIDLGFYGFSHSETDESLYTRFNTGDNDKESGEDE